MCNKQTSIVEQLNHIFPRRVALSVANRLCDLVSPDPQDLVSPDPQDLVDVRIPATFCTDLRHAAPKAVARFGLWLASHGAALVR